MSKRKLKCFSLQEKIEIISQLESGKKQRVISTEKNIPRSTISDIWTNRARIINQHEVSHGECKKVKRAVYEDVDSAVLQWFKVARNAGVPLSGVVVMEKAKEFATMFNHQDFKGSEGWLNKWKKRHRITFRSISGEARSVIDEPSLDDWLTNKWPQLSAGYSENNIFSCDETELFYKMLPDKYLRLEGDGCGGGKNSQERITLLLGFNSTGTEKLKPLVIGKSKKPRPFESVNVNSLPVEYFNNKEAWMTAKIFEKWLRGLDENMICQKRRILLTLDSCTAHTLANVELKNVKLVFFPPNCPSKVQGIINEVKKTYRGIIVRKILNKIDSKTKPDINILESIFAISSAWSELSASTINNCFRLSRLIRSAVGEEVSALPEGKGDAEDADELLLSELAEKLQVERSAFPSFRDYVQCVAEVEASGIPTVAEIAESFNQDLGTAEEGNVEEEQPDIMSSSEFLESINRLKHFVVCQENTNEGLFDSLNQLEKFGFQIQLRKLIQSKISEYHIRRPLV